MTDGWDVRPPDGSPTSAYPPQPPAETPPASLPPASPPPASPPTSGPPRASAARRPGGASPWWSDALADPWRDPHAPSAVVVQHQPQDDGAALEPVPDPDAAPRRGLGPLLLITVVAALLAGLLGGALGYTFATRHDGGGALQGAGSRQVPAAAKRPPDTLAGVAERVLPSVVTVKVAGGGSSAVGSGFIVSQDGYVITNDHVVSEVSGSPMIVFNDGSTAAGKVVGQDTESDIAVIKVSRTGLAPVQFGDSEAIAVGDPVLAFGSPLALANTVTSGIVSALDRTIQSDEPGGPVRYYAAIQTDAAVNQGNSGGPLVDGGGRVVGVNSVIKSLGAEDEQAGNIGLAFAIPINQAKRVAQDIIDTGKARRTVIGAQFEAAFRNPNGGVRLSSVDSEGPAGGAGLRAGDVVTKLDGHPLEEPADLIALVRKYAPGSVVNVEFRRGSARQTASVTLAADVQ
ncbi:MAG TPA: trypsin-like peptidase domain-containing protein [Micromonosporaceae bacterium]